MLCQGHRKNVESKRSRAAKQYSKMQLFFRLQSITSCRLTGELNQLIEQLLCRRSTTHGMRSIDRSHQYILSRPMRSVIDARYEASASRGKVLHRNLHQTFNVRPHIPPTKAHIATFTNNQCASTYHADKSAMLHTQE